MNETLMHYLYVLCSMCLPYSEQSLLRTFLYNEHLIHLRSALGQKFDKETYVANAS